MFRKITLLVALSTLTPSVAGSADFIRDEMRVNMRSGPGSGYRIERTLTSGDKLRRIEERGDWLLVRIGKNEGWVLSRFITQKAPSSVVLPGVQNKLANAKERIETLETQLTTQATVLEEIDFLRLQNATLEEANLFWSDSRKNLLTGAGIAAVFLLLGFLWQGSSGSSKRSDRIKL